MNKNNQRILNKHQKDFLKHYPYVLNGTVIYFSTWDTSDFIVIRGAAPLYYLDENRHQKVGSPMFRIRWNRTTTQRSGIFTIAITDNVLKRCKDHIENPGSFFGDDDDINFTPDEHKLLINCMKQYVEIETNPDAYREAKEKIFLDR